MSITRRQLLRRAASCSAAAALGPALSRFSPRTSGARRFVFVVKASGIDRHNLMPGANDATVADDYALQRTGMVDTALALPTILDALTPWRERVTIVQGLSGRNFKGNHTAGYGTLSCHDSERVPVAPTVDALLGANLSKGPYQLYGMATNGTLLGQASVPDDAHVFPNISALGSGRGVAFQASPRRAYDELFGAATTSDEELAKAATIQRNLTAFLEQDAQRVRGGLHEHDRGRFDGYVDAFDALRDREAKKAALKHRIAAFAPAFDAERYDAMTHMQRMACQFELGTAALQAGLTNVVTLRPDTLGAQYGALGAGMLGVHAIGHGTGVPEGPTSPELRRRIDHYQLGLVAKMAERLAATPEADGSMLDHTVIVFLSCAGGSHHGGNADWPAVLVAGAATGLRGGRYVQYPSYGKDGHKTLGNLYLRLLASAGIECGEHFGQADPQLRHLDVRGPLAELQA